MSRRAVPVFRLFFSLFAAIFLCASSFALGQSSSPRSRIIQPVNASSTIALPGSVNPRAKSVYDIGPASPATRLTGITVYFRLSAAQQAALDTLLKEQQTPGSQLYHKWITPAQYAARFGLSDSDISKVETWLEQQGFTIDGIDNSHNAITFSGSIAQVESAFQTEIHRYRIRGVTHIANATPLSIPSAFAGVILSVRNITDFRPHPLHRLRHAAPRYTVSSGGTTYHFVAPGDFATIYNVSPLYSAGYTGSGVTIVITGQSAITASDITNFQKAAGLPQNAPATVLVPNTGSSALNDSSGDEDESDIDLEWSGAVAKGASIKFVYVGNNTNYGVFDALQYAIDHKLGPIVSISYGACEADFASADVTTIQGWLQQANAQGQTIVAAAGDEGATDCETSTGSSPSVVNGDEATLGLAVDLPASSPYVTGIGGTEFSGDLNSAGTYWNPSNGAGENSAIQYIPEKVWNDTSTTNGIEAGGGGASVLFSKPSWQAGSGVPNDGHRDVPDVSLNASPNHDGYVYCASGSDMNDPTACSNGFLDSKSSLEIAGGTSFGAPTFSGILALLAQKLGSSGLGNINSELYSLAATDYSGIFHDVTSGDNKIPCETGKPDCSSSPIGYSAGAGYDQASGWGSINAANFVNSYATASTSTATATNLTSSSAAPVVNTSVTITATVTRESGSATPVGTVQFSVDGTNQGSPVTLSSSGQATFTYTPASAGTHTIVANYTPSNSAVSDASSGTLTLTVSAPSPLAISATNVSVAQGASGTSTVSITSIPAGFSGTVSLSVSAPASLTNACFTYVNPSVSSSGTATGGSVTVNTSKTACTTIGNSRGSAAVSVRRGSGGALPGALSGVAFAALLFLGFPGLRRRRWPVLCAVLCVALASLAVSGCGTSVKATPTPASPVSPTGTYTLTLTGTNTASNKSASTTFTLTVTQ